MQTEHVSVGVVHDLLPDRSLWGGAHGNPAAHTQIGENPMNIPDFLRQEKVKFEVIPHGDTYDAQHLAQAVHVSGRLVAKTVLLRAREARCMW